MDKTKIKKFAIDARRQLIDEITLKMNLLGITKDGIQEPTNATNDIQFFGDFSITGNDIQRRKKLIAELQSRSTGKTLAETLPVFIEEIAYTWFNRLIAIRFMEVNHYLPGRIRVLSSEIEGQDQPDIIKEALNSDLVFTEAETEQIKFALLDQTVDVMNDLYKMIFIKQANQLNTVLPELFEKIADYSELLFTPNYTDVNGVIHKLVHDIDESDFDVKASGQVEIIGWLYQYYNTEPKDYVIGLPKSVKYDDVQIAHATQIFTPDWIVQYMVENSLGKYWVKTLLARGDERSEKEIAEEFGWKYYMIDADQSNEVQTKLIEIDGNLSSASVEDLKVIDPSMGSGHILVYAFDVLMNIYESEGYSNRDAAKLIIERNLYGLDIDKRAFQLSYFAIMMKYRQYSRRALTSGSKLNLFDIPSTKMYHVDNFDLLSDSVSENTLKDIKQLVTLFQSGDDIGSLLHIPSVNFENIINELDSVLTGQMSFEVIPLVEVIQNIVDVSQLLADKYQAVITNPPYMGSSRMNETLATFAKKEYPRAKSDLFAMFIERWHKSLTAGGYNAMVTMQSWMFLSSFEEMRVHLLNSYTISNLMHMENNVMGIAFGTAVTITRNMHIPEFKGTYHQIKTADASTTVPEKVPIDGNRFNRTNQANFEKIPGSPIAYWASNALLHDFEVGVRMDELVDPRQGLATADNNRFLRQWYEIDIQNISFNSKSIAESIVSNKKWFPYNKGGAYRKWYGNYDYVVNWENDGAEIRNFKGPNGKIRSRPQNTDYYFREAITWSDVNSGKFSLRYREYGSIHDVKGMSAFETGDLNLFYLLGLLNSPLGNYIFGLLNPTISLQIGNFQSFPVLKLPNDTLVSHTSHQSVDLAKEDWDAFETSWDFDCHPLLSKIAEHNQKTPP